MIKKIRIKNFKCYGPRGADFNLSRVNFIFGDNSAGKSTFLQFLAKIGEVCKLDGKCDRGVFDKYTFKSQPADISAKIRVSHGEEQDEVWTFGVSKENKSSYDLTDEKGKVVDLERLSAVLSATGGENIVHVVANRFRNSHEDGSADWLGKFERKIKMETVEKARDYVNDILSRLGVPYTCITEENANGVSDTSIHDEDFDVDLPVAEVGTGIDGLFHLALTLNDWQSGILAIEEPETNVGEEQMAALARILVEEALKRSSGQLIVECHSKIMALQLIDLVRRGVLTCGAAQNANLSVIVVRKTREGSMVEDVKIDTTGDVSWPRGFFPAEGNILRTTYGVC